jgi:hypothetical protein
VALTPPQASPASSRMRLTLAPGPFYSSRNSVERPFLLQRVAALPVAKLVESEKVQSSRSGISTDTLPHGVEVCMQTDPGRLQLPPPSSASEGGQTFPSSCMNSGFVELFRSA